MPLRDYSLRAMMILAMSGSHGFDVSRCGSARASYKAPSGVNKRRMADSIADAALMMTLHALPCSALTHRLRKPADVMRSAQPGDTPMLREAMTYTGIFGEKGRRDALAFGFEMPRERPFDALSRLA